MSFLALYLRLFFLLTPFFVLGAFLTMTEGADAPLRRRLAIRITLGCSAITLLIFLLGTPLMRLFDITVDAFRMGAGALLLITAINQVLGKDTGRQVTTSAERLLDQAIVPMATPITAGPATLGTLMVMGNTAMPHLERLYTCGAILLACLSVGAMLLTAPYLQKSLGKDNISILSKISGLILSAIAMQMMLVGAKNLWGA